MSVTFAQGFSAAGVAAGISAVEGKKDLALVVNNGPLDAAAGVFTSNRFCAAPVQWSRNIVSDGHVKAVILNSGGANACTGKPGYEQSKATAEKVAGLIGAKAEDVAVCSLVSSANCCRSTTCCPARTRHLKPLPIPPKPEPMRRTPS